MFTHTTTIRIRYADTDQMGFVHHGNYATMYETGRVEALRSLGIAYKDVELAGILMPVIDMQSKYLKPARFDDLLTIETILKELPTSHIQFHFEVLNELGELLNTGEVKLVFINKKNHRPVRCPGPLLEKLRPFFA
ncbi:MAG: acyl-CoA thioesterase [Flavobacteriaceae bacterium]|nr:acyl-CoA thioesterase [Flavobacteriaceae bacterium]